MKLDRDKIEKLIRIDEEGVPVDPLPLYDPELVKGEIVSSLKVLPNIPSLIPGRWDYAFIFISSREPLHVYRKLCDDLDFVVGGFFNISIPYGAGHDLVLELYTTDIDSVLKKVNGLEDVDYFELKVFDTLETDSPYLPDDLDLKVIKRFLDVRAFDMSFFSDIVEEYGEENFMLSITRLFKSGRNFQSPFTLSHDIYWYKVENYLHLHFILSGKNFDDALHEFYEHGFYPLEGKIFRGFYHVEKDIYSPGELMASLNSLKGIAGKYRMDIEGILIHTQHLVNENLIDVFLKKE